MKILNKYITLVLYGYLFVLLSFGINKAQTINLEYSDPVTKITHSTEWISCYEANAGRIFGSWPVWMRASNPVLRKELKYRYGFNYIFIPGGSSNDWALDAGYDLQHMMFQGRMVDDTKPDWNYNVLMPKYPGAFAFYSDEPGSNEWSSIYSTKQKAHSYGSNFFIGDGEIKSSAYYYADGIMCTWYSGYLGSTDQRPRWTDFRDEFGSYFSMTWISGTKDGSDFDDLLGHAMSLGLTGVWFYQQLEPDTVDEKNNLNNFATISAPRQGWSHFIGYQNVRYEYVNGVKNKVQFIGPLNSTILSDNSSYNLNGTVTNNRIDDYYASGTITASYNPSDPGSSFYEIPSGKHASFCSWQQIILKPGFHAANGSNFHAYLGTNFENNPGMNQPAVYSSTKVLVEERNESIDNASPKDFKLSQNYPNPFNPTTKIEYSLPRDSYITLKIYDLLGREIISLINEYQRAGNKYVIWNGKDQNGNLVSSGTYIYKLFSPEFTESKTMQLVK